MLLSDCWFTNALGGLVDWTYSGVANGYQSPTVAGAVDGKTYLYRAQTFDGTRWEVGTGAYTASSGKFARTTVLFNSAGTTAKINFPTPPHIVIRDPGDVFTGNVSITGDLIWGGAPWVTYTTFVAPTGGSLSGFTATVAKYKKLGKLVLFKVDLTMGTFTGASGRLKIGLPSNPADTFNAAGSGINVTGIVNLCGFVYDLSAAWSVQTAAGAFPAASGDRIIMQGWYEEA